eukprot:1160513-Pelagomonas_calceolata.AAC.25
MLPALRPAEGGSKPADNKHRICTMCTCLHELLSGLEKEAVQLHEGFLSAWREFGWLPELFGLELEQIDPHDPGCASVVFTVAQKCSKQICIRCR